jgi:hypothetical protein
MWDGGGKAMVPRRGGFVPLVLWLSHTRVAFRRFQIPDRPDGRHRGRASTDRLRSSAPGDLEYFLVKRIDGIEGMRGIEHTYAQDRHFKHLCTSAPIRARSFVET